MNKTLNNKSKPQSGFEYNPWIHVEEPLLGIGGRGGGVVRDGLLGAAAADIGRAAAHGVRAVVAAHLKNNLPLFAII